MANIADLIANRNQELEDFKQKKPQLLHPTKQREQKTGTEGGTEDGAL